MADGVQYPTDDHVTNTETEEPELLEVPGEDDKDDGEQVPG